MRIAIVWNHDSQLVDCSFRFEQYVAGFRALGHEPVLVCWEGNDVGFELQAHTYPADRFETEELWREIDADVAVIVTWHRMAAVLAAMRSAGTAVVAISDSDGQVGVRVHPRASFERLWVYQDGLVGKLRCTKYWAMKYLRDGFGETEEHLASTEHSSALVLGSRRGKENFEEFLLRYQRHDLLPKLTFAPFAIGASYLAWPVSRVKQDRIVAIGRWADPQKNALLLKGAIEQFLTARPSTEIIILGSGGEPVFGQLATRFPQVEYRGEVQQDEVAEVLSTARSIVFSSRWEGSPHAAKEALALGATIIGTPIPSLVSWSEGGRYGRTATTSTAPVLAQTMMEEMTAWDVGTRDPLLIAREWRARLSPEAVCGFLLDALASAESSDQI